RLEATLDNTTGSGELHREVTTRLQTLLSRWLEDEGEEEAGEEQAVSGRLEDASASEVLDFINNELGLS
ncbi:hypothetical protein ACFV3R_09660, partial [Streptomyces sp. NPDC059740]|uniref:hypothetical protein n=1 Tax=Streptomyces sp. NPDC059740 TaxID=3346926 RepID=UPI00364A2FDD